jgi:hypothetical protein
MGRQSIRIIASMLLATAWLAGCQSDLACGPESLLCTRSGTAVCLENVLRTCTLLEDGCLIWKYIEDCSESGMVCEQEGEAAACRLPCNDPCDTETASRCEDLRVQACARSDRGCLQWVDDTDCAALGQNCVENAGKADCEPFCVGDCDVVGASRCSGSTIMTCRAGEDDCLRWTLEAACEPPRPVCVDTREPAACIGDDCALPADCGARGDAVCLTGFCTRYDASTGYGSAVVDLSFARELYASSPSGKLYFLLPETSHGRIRTCADILSGAVPPGDITHNFLRSSPRLLIFHWEDNQTYFPNNLVQFIRPAESVLLVAAGYQGANGHGALMAIGCVGDLDIIRDHQIEVTVPLIAPSP